MPRSKRAILAAATEGTTPPEALPPTQQIARVGKPAGSNLYAVALPSGREVLVEMPARFRNAVYVRRGGYVLVDTAAFAGRDNKLAGEIVCVVREEKAWRRMGYWPEEFAGRGGDAAESDGEEVRGRMPPSEGEEEDTSEDG